MSLSRRFYPKRLTISSYHVMMTSYTSAIHSTHKVSFIYRTSGATLNTTRRRLYDFHNKYKAEIVFIYSMESITWLTWLLVRQVGSLIPYLRFVPADRFTLLRTPAPDSRLVPKQGKRYSKGSVETKCMHNKWHCRYPHPLITVQRQCCVC